MALKISFVTPLSGLKTPFLLELLKILTLAQFDEAYHSCRRLYGVAEVMRRSSLILETARLASAMLLCLTC